MVRFLSKAISVVQRKTDESKIKIKDDTKNNENLTMLLLYCANKLANILRKLLNENREILNCTTTS